MVNTLLPRTSNGDRPRLSTPIALTLLLNTATARSRPTAEVPTLPRNNSRILLKAHRRGSMVRRMDKDLRPASTATSSHTAAHLRHSKDTVHHHTEAADSTVLHRRNSHTSKARRPRSDTCLAR